MDFDVKDLRHRLYLIDEANEIDKKKRTQLKVDELCTKLIPLFKDVSQWKKHTIGENYTCYKFEYFDQRDDVLFRALPLFMERIKCNTGPMSYDTEFAGNNVKIMFTLSMM